MNNVQLLIPVLLCIFITSCSRQHPDDLAYSAGKASVVCYSKQLPHLEFVGWRGYFDKNGKLETVAGDYLYENAITLEESRTLMVDAVKTFLTELNQDISIRKYLCHYPFTVTDIRLTIRFFFSDDPRPDGCIMYSSSQNGKLYYCINNKTEGMMQDLHRETYADAQKIVGENPSILAILQKPDRPADKISEPFPFLENVEQLLASTGKKWKMVESVSDDEGRYYLPADCIDEVMEGGKFTEAFTIRVMDFKDAGTWDVHSYYKEAMKVLVGGEKSGFILSSDENSLLIELNLNYIDQFSWIKFIKHNDSLIFLQYSVNNKRSLIDAGRTTWVPILKNASIP
jgi:hypothetical protein